MAYTFSVSPSQDIVATINQEALPITMAGHFILTTNGNNNILYRVFDNANSTTSFHRARYTGSYNYETRSENTSGNSGTATASVGVAVNIWLHGASLFTATNSRRTYLNGTNTALNTSTVNGVVYNRLALGGSVASTGGSIRLAEFALWTDSLTAEEVEALYKGFKPHRIRPQKLLYYIPLVRDVSELRSGLSLTQNNTPTVFEHPRVY